MTRAFIGDAQRRARLAARHRLAARSASDDLIEATRSVVALHSSDPATVYLSLRARSQAVTPGDIERSLYEDRSLVRLLGMRRTLYVVPRDLVAPIQRGAADPIAVRERTRLMGMLEASGVAPALEPWLRELEASALNLVARRGEAFAADIGRDDPRLRTKLTLARGKRYEAEISVSTRILLLLGAEGRLVRGRPRGSWISSQYRWSTAEHWLGAPIEGAEPAAARAAVVRRWLTSFGPGTLDDLRWWTGWTVREVRAALAAVDAIEVDLEAGPGFVLRGDEAPVLDPEPAIALLPALDPTTMGWAARDWYLGPHRPRLFDTNGNAGPTIWWGGRVVGGWAQRPDGTVATRLLQDVGRETVLAVDAEAARLAEWLGPIRFVPRFRTPLDRELSA
jgi:hypothetical protein